MGCPRILADSRTCNYRACSCISHCCRKSPVSNTRRYLKKKKHSNVVSAFYAVQDVLACEKYADDVWHDDYTKTNVARETITVHARYTRSPAVLALCWDGG